MSTEVFSRRVMVLAGSAVIASHAALAHPHKKKTTAPTPAAAPKPAASDDEEGSASVAVNSSPADTPLGPLDTTAAWAYIIDFNTASVLLDKQGDVQMPPSSMTKLMTAYIVYSKLKAGELRLDQTLPVSETAWRMQGSKMFVELGASIKVEDLIRGMIIQSGNDACLVLAEGIAGSESQFVDQMNQMAKKIGLTNSYFKNCTGWPDPEHHMSAHDIAILARRIIKDFPEYYHFDSEKTFTYHGIVQYNRNPLVQRGLADGLKTGHTDAGGFGVVGSAEHNGRRVIMVLNGMPTGKARVEESIRLMSWAFANFENVTLFSASDVIDKAPVWLGTKPTVPLMGGEDVVMTLPHGWRSRIKVQVHYQSPIPAPIYRGDVVGTLTIGGERLPQAQIQLLAGEDVQRLGVLGRAMARLTHSATGQ